jgi:hypothetical protein
MSARDIYHEAVKQALIKDGWTITHDPLTLRSGGATISIDLGAEKQLIAAQKGNSQIAVEVKSFIGHSVLSEYHLALGQFINYRQVLEAEQSGMELYLAVPLGTYRTFFALPFAQNSIERNQLLLIVFDPDKEVVLEWIK